MQDDLVLRDIHYADSPSWWPPAPGWWLIILTSLIVALLVIYLIRKRRKRYQQIAALFDNEIAAQQNAVKKLVVISELLKRAAIKKYPDLDISDEKKWFEQLNGKGSDFSAYQDLLLEGQYRPDVDQLRVSQLIPLARKRFIQWMYG